MNWLHRDVPAELSGAAAERLAREHLEQQGLTTLSTNYRTRRGEIDIICRDGETLVFVEVRSRKRDQFGSAAESVDYRKQQKLINAAHHYLQQQRLTDRVRCRFDVVCVSPRTIFPNNQPPNRNRYRVEWLPNAFAVN